MKISVFVLALGVILLHSIAAATAYPVLYVGSNGLTAWPCGTDSSQPCKSIATAVAHANDYETTTIKVAQGDYAEFIYITDALLQPLAIEGGWNADFTLQSHDPGKTRVTSSSNDAVMKISVGSLGQVNMRLAYLTFHGTTDPQRIGIEASTSNSILALTIEHCHIVSYRGQAISLSADLVSDMTFTLYDTIIQGNYQPQEDLWPGAGVSAELYGDSTGEFVLTNNKIIENQSLAGGGLYFYVNGAALTATLKNNILAGNESNGGGGAIEAVAGGTGTMELTLTNDTITNNIAPTKGVGISLFSNDTATITAFLTNTIVWESATDIFMEEAMTSAISLTADYSIIGEVDNTGGGTYVNKSSNLNVDPLLTPTYHLSSASPAKDKGICGIKFISYLRIAPVDDIDGDARPGDGTILGCDIGADEYKFSWTLFNPAFIRNH